MDRDRHDHEMTDLREQLSRQQAALGRQQETIARLDAYVSELRSQQASPRPQVRRPHRLLLIGSAIALVLAAMGGIAYATIPSGTDGLIHGCFAKSDGTLRLISVDGNPPAKCNNTETAVSWSPNGVPSHIQEVVDTSPPTHITVPAYVTSVEVEIWGAGGGGGASILCGTNILPTSGGGGGSGGYVREILNLAPGEFGHQLTVTLGKGGTGTSGDGTDGGNTTIVGSKRFSSLAASGGKGGKAAQCNGSTGVPGQSGAGGGFEITGGTAIPRAGQNGVSGPGQALAVQGTVAPRSGDSMGGFGNASPAGPGGSGGDGYAIISW